jgi:acetyl-CoA C-acetyltransferase
MESMTNAPHLLPGLRKGHKYGAVEMLDSMAYDGLVDAFDHIPMGESTDRYSERLGITRAEQDEFAARSHQRAAAAQKNGLFDEEIVPVQVPQRRGDPSRSARTRGSAGTPRRGAGQAEAGVRRGRDDHRRQLVADLRRAPARWW